MITNLVQRVTTTLSLIALMGAVRPPSVAAEGEQPQPLFSSSVISAKTEGHAVDVDVGVRGKKSLFLVVTDASDGIGCDFANWSDARFTTADGPIDLRDLKWRSAKTSWGSVAIDATTEGQPMRIDGKPVRGLGTHANSIIQYAIPKNAIRFQAVAGVDSQGTDEGCGSTVRFFVYTERPDIHFEPAKMPGSDEHDHTGESAAAFESDQFFRSDRDRTGAATPAETLKLPEGFKAELIYTVPLDKQGSWVSLTVDDRGRLIASDQWSGLYRITLARQPDGQPQVARLELDQPLGGCQGLLYHRDCLYAVVNGERSGLYRLRDTNRDDRFDLVELLRQLDGEGEHGPHAVIASLEGNSLLLIGGNGSFPGERVDRSRVPRVWQEDRLITRTSASDGPWEPEENRIGGWIVRTDLDGREFELVSMGFRNPYDLAVSREGELFTFDSDMEWDTGTPWYRPNRVNHVISGADFGWRAGQAKWPEHYFDGFGSVIDIGLASPTGVIFGYGAKFPPKYQETLFACDWSLGNIYAVHLTPHGSSYQGDAEPFVVGAPLPVTDVVIHPKDGAMYFTVGGRGVTSALYRVSYEGRSGTEPASKSAAGSPEDSARQLRRELESFHSNIAENVELSKIWRNLDSQDRAIRYAARIALEHQPLEQWRDRLESETNPRRLIAASLAWARHAGPDERSMLMNTLGKLGWDDLNQRDRSDFLRLLAVSLARHGRGDGFGQQLRNLAAERLRAVFPTGNYRIDSELAEILALVDGPNSIDRILGQLLATDTQEAQIFYAMCLRDIDAGWTLAQREQLLKWFHSTSSQRGGVLFGDYLEQIHRAVVGQIDRDDWREQLAELLELPRPSDPMGELKSRQVVRRWTMNELQDELGQVDSEANLRRGREVFRDALCYRCHRVKGQGGMIGPDLSSVSRRFNTRDLLESIVAPNKVISDQFRAVQILTDDGRILTGKVTDIHGNSLVIMNNVLDPSDLTTIQRDRIEEMSWSDVSTMPSELLDTFSAVEIADMLSFLSEVADR